MSEIRVLMRRVILNIIFGNFQEEKKKINLEMEIRLGQKN